VPVVFDGAGGAPLIATRFPKSLIHRFRGSNHIDIVNLVLRALSRARLEEIMPASILRDAVLRTAPRDEVRGLRLHPVQSDRFHGINPQATGILLQLLLGTFDHAIRIFDAQLGQLRVQLDDGRSMPTTLDWLISARSFRPPGSGLFRDESIIEISRDPRYVGATVGVLASRLGGDPLFVVLQE
jgi:hypothetical protein